jgi:hypothetical protein
MKTFIWIVLVLPFTRVFTTNKETWLWMGKTILTILAPILIVFGVFNILLIIGSFAFWKLPNHFYIPFNGGYNQMIADRMLIVAGLVLTLFKKQL